MSRHRHGAGRGRKRREASAYEGPRFQWLRNTWMRDDEHQENSDRLPGHRIGYGTREGIVLRGKEKAA